MGPANCGLVSSKSPKQSSRWTAIGSRCRPAAEDPRREAAILRPSGCGRSRRTAPGQRHSMRAQRRFWPPGFPQSKAARKRIRPRTTFARRWKTGGRRTRILESLDQSAKLERSARALELRLAKLKPESDAYNYYKAQLDQQQLTIRKLLSDAGSDLASAA